MGVKEFSFRDAYFVVNATKIYGVRGFSYKTAREKEALTVGGKVAAIQHGDDSNEGELTLTQTALQALEASVSTGNLLDASLNLVVVFDNGVRLRTDIISGLEFTEVPEGMAEGDKFSEHTLPWLAVDVKKNV